MVRIEERIENVGELRRLTRTLGRLQVPDDAELTNRQTGRVLVLSIEVVDDEPFDGEGGEE